MLPCDHGQPQQGADDQAEDRRAAERGPQVSRAPALHLSSEPQGCRKVIARPSRADDRIEPGLRNRR